ncbi:MAG: adenylate cyclase-like protein [Conexibacter sp.]|nr:adenylate cyclase-like protein [Conexibacter sp.]
MENMQDESLWLESLSDKVLHQLPHAVWRGLFLGPERESIHFEQRHLTLVYVDIDVPAGQPGAATDRFYQELQKLNTRHNGRLDPYVNATALATFENPGAAVRMAIELQRAAAGIALRIGVVSGLCTLAFFRVQGRLWCTPLGAQPARAAEVAATAAVGGIVISPETYGANDQQSRGQAASQGPDFEDSEVDLSSLAYDTAVDGIDIRC